MRKQGRLAEIIYYNEDNYYTVADVENDEETERFTIVGNLPDVREGVSYSFEGEWKVHRSYGEQFAVTSYDELMPDSTDGIVDFLASGIFKGVGRKTAKRITSVFGEDTLKVIEETPQDLTKVSGIGENKAASIAADYQNHREYARISLFFREYGIEQNHAMKLYKTYGADTISLILENPYRTVNEIPGIGFNTADQIAMKIGIAPDSAFRKESGIRHVLYRYVSDGHVFVPMKELCENVAEFLGLISEDINDTLMDMAVEGVVRIEELENRNVVYLYRYCAAENFVCRQLMSLNDAAPRIIPSEVDRLIRMTENETGIRLSGGQADAVRSAVENCVCVITGGPGTGKTTIINTIIRIFEASEMKVAIAAPTGRASKRVTETSGHYASTVHRLLEYYYSEDVHDMNFGKDEESPLEYDAVIVDESSMLDILLTEGLLKAMRPGMRLILVGDVDQLPSVGAGNVLRDIIDSEAVHCVSLKEIFRQADESMITVNAHRINKGEYPHLNEKDKDFFILRKNSETMIVETIKDLCLTRLPGYYEGTDPVKDIQVLTPVRKGLLGTVNLNRELQAILNPSSPEKNERVMRERLFREGDKVMQIKNNYRLKWKRTDDFSEGEGVFNGDVGYISSIDKEEDTITVLFDDIKSVKYDNTQIGELETSYAVTVHKSQGSEFPIVVMPIWYFPPMLAVRNLLYTAVTRGRNLVVLVGDERRLNAMIDNNRIDERYSGLNVKLSRYLNL